MVLSGTSSTGTRCVKPFVKEWKVFVDVGVGWFEGRQESSCNQNASRFTKNLVWEWLKSGKNLECRIIYMSSSTCPLLSVFGNCGRQHVGPDGPSVWLTTHGKKKVTFWKLQSVSTTKGQAVSGDQPLWLAPGEIPPRPHGKLVFACNRSSIFL